MILTITLNAALDVTYHVPELIPGTTHRVDAVTTRPGGKGINAARVLGVLGADYATTGFAGGPTGDEFLQELDDSDIPEMFLRIAGETRRTLVVSTMDGTATLFNEPGPEVVPAEWNHFLLAYQELADRASVILLSGSIPPGVPDNAYAELIRCAVAPVILDADGVALREGVAARPAVIKPNAAELAGLTGLPVDSPASALVACRAVEVPVVAVTLGEQGAVLSTPDGQWSAAPPEPLRGNPTGAGDAFAAALAHGMDTGVAWPQILANAVAMSAAAVLEPTASGLDHDAYLEFRDAVTVRPE